jgi:hypothetical protein
MKSKKYEAPKYEHPIYDINWTAGAGQPAGMYWLDGRILMAAHDSPPRTRCCSRAAYSSPR